MTLTLLVIAIAIICAIVLTWAKRSKNQSELDRHSISVEQLQSMMVSGQEVFLFDVRQPLDLLAYPELIPGAKRIPPEQALKTTPHCSVEMKISLFTVPVRVIRPAE